MRIAIESMLLGNEDDGFSLIMTISNNGHSWSSGPAILKAETITEANKEMADQIGKLQAVILGRPGEGS